MINIQGLNIDLRDFHLRDINLDVAENEFFILMGPTGAGKTVLLEVIAGLVPIKSGRISIGGRDITGLPPEKRGISIVYQDYALFPHLNVRDNITYGLHFHRSYCCFLPCSVHAQDQHPAESKWTGLLCWAQPLNAS